ncbi:hypothetical protein [Pseudomonas sp. LjRoot263]|uniref:hypothetical protein n=1 Tax=Pseudomonas sp. LjRoot263 TaxID=3342302 RepID=UPI003ECCAB5B
MTKLDVRLAALSKLVDIKSPEVEHRLSEEFSRIKGLLQRSTEYDELSDALKTLAVLVPRFHMATLPLLVAFIHSLPNRILTENGTPIASTRNRYRSTGSLIRDAIDVANNIRFVHTEEFVSFLLEMSLTIDKEVKAKAERTIEALATFDLDIFYGKPPLGAQPQTRMVAHFAGLHNESLLTNSNIILRALRIVLSPSMEGTSWSYSSVTIRRRSIANDGGVAALRSEAIALTKRIYGLDTSVEHRRHVLQTLSSATRRDSPSNDESTSVMFERDAIVVLEFMHDLVATEALPLIQKIEHQSYWAYVHGATQAIKDKALKVRDAVDAHAEYQIYKQLIGFEGIFGKWEDLSRSEKAWDYSDKKRREAARQYLEEINEASYDIWRDRIIAFSHTRSDDLAMFPVYYDFLESIGKEKSRLAVELVTHYEELMTPFLIALVRGLWASANPLDVGTIVKRWINDGKHLSAIAKSLYQADAPRLEVLSEIVDRAAELDDRETLIQTISVAANLFSEGELNAKAIFMRSIREMANRNDTSWANVTWITRSFRDLVNSMEPGERTEVLATLNLLPELNYQAEDLLYEIATHDLNAVINYFMGRLEHARSLEKRNRQYGDNENERFEPIPYQLDRLNELLAHAPEALLTALRSDFDMEVGAMFTYRGARLIKSVFPEFGGSLEKLLLKYVEMGDDQNIEFVLCILRAYDGSMEILTVCKEIIVKVPEHSKFWNEVAAAIESTGVVCGEYGMAEAYELKLLEISRWLEDDDARVQVFAEWLLEGLRSLIDQERQRADQGLALRKYQYGVGKQDD